MSVFVNCFLIFFLGFFLGFMVGRSVGWWNHAEWIEENQSNE